MAELESMKGELPAQTMPIDLLGEYHFKVDSKGRVSVPSKFRDAFAGKSLVLTRDLTDECLYLFTDTDFNAWVEQLFIDKFGGFKQSDKMHISLRRKLKSRAFEVDFDVNGRITANAEMRKAVGIENEVVVVGNTGHAEIWAADRYQQEDAEIDLGIFYS